MREISWVWIVFEGHGDLGHLLLIILAIGVVFRLKDPVLFGLFVNVPPVAGYLLKLHNNYIYYHITPIEITIQPLFEFHLPFYIFIFSMKGALELSDIFVPISVV